MERVFRYDTAVFNLLVLVGISAAICGLPYLLLRRTRRDAVLHYALFLAVGIFGAAVACLALWLSVGGWGPPAPILFAVVGIGFGLLLGKSKWQGHPPS